MLPYRVMRTKVKSLDLHQIWTAYLVLGPTTQSNWKRSTRSPGLPLLAQRLHGSFWHFASYCIVFPLNVCHPGPLYAPWLHPSIDQIICKWDLHYHKSFARTTEKLFTNHDILFLSLHFQLTSHEKSSDVWIIFFRLHKAPSFTVVSWD
jgi:hypothetical protein